jgi:hypothetical protein
LLRHYLGECVNRGVEECLAARSAPSWWRGLPFGRTDADAPFPAAWPPALRLQRQADFPSGLRRNPGRDGAASLALTGARLRRRIRPGGRTCLRAPTDDTAEVIAYRNLGADIFNHSIAPEATLAREIGACFVPLAFVTAGFNDYFRLAGVSVLQDGVLEGLSPVASRVLLEAAARLPREKNASVSLWSQSNPQRDTTAFDPQAIGFQRGIRTLGNSDPNKLNGL